MVCPTLLIDHSKYFAVSLIGLNLPDISTQPAGLERCEQYIIDTINKKKKLQGAVGTTIAFDWAACDTPSHKFCYVGRLRQKMTSVNYLIL